MRRAGRAKRHRLRSQLGLTLSELIVAMAVLSIIAGSIAGAFGIGLRLIGPTGAPARLTGNSDLLAFEQQIGADIARADCLRAPGQTSIPSPSTTVCTLSVQASPSTCGSGYSLCLAWWVPGSVCHTVTYSQQSNGAVVRSDVTPTSNTPARIATGGLTIAATWTPTSTSNNIPSYKWAKAVQIIVTQQGIAGAPAVKQPVTTTFQLVPLTADPLSPVLPGGTSPC
jgi:prepilin-type N-terminal cleavage/methylation domain-containing protein